MGRFTIHIWSLLLLAVPAPAKSIAPFSTATSRDMNARFQEGSTSGIISTVAGYKTLNEGDTADGIAATNAKLDSPEGLAIDKDGNFYIANSKLNKVQKVTVSTGIITTVAGTGLKGYSGDGEKATSAKLAEPSGLSLDTSGNIFIADSKNHRIRKVTVSTGIITTVAGNGTGGYTVGNNIAATSSALDSPHDVAVDASGNIFIADTQNGRIRKVAASTGVMTTIAGTGVISYFPPPTSVATEYNIYAPTGVTLDTSGNVYIAGSSDPCIFKVTASTGTIAIVAGTGPIGEGRQDYNGDNQLATKALLNFPGWVALDASGNIFISDTGNRRIRKVTVSTGMITTVAGTGKPQLLPNIGDGGSATSVAISQPNGIAFDAIGNFYFCDRNLGVVKKVTKSVEAPSTSVTLAPSLSPAPSTVGTTASRPSSPSAPASTASTAPAPSSSTGSNTSSTSHVAQALHLAMIFLSSVVCLYLYQEAWTKV